MSLMDPSKLCHSFNQFVLEVKKREGKKEKGLRKMKDIELLASLEWQHMTGTERKIYRDRALTYKKSEEYLKLRRPKTKIEKEESLNALNATTSDDKNSTDDNQTQKVVGNKECQRKDRDAFLKALRWNLGDYNLHEKIGVESFFVISIQNFIDTDDHCTPAEISLVRFTLLKGIVDELNILLKPLNKISVSYSKSDDLESIKRTHRIFVDDPPIESRDDFENIVDELKQFCSGQERRQFRLFALSDQILATKRGLSALGQQIGDNTFRLSECISNVEDLLMVLNLCKPPCGVGVVSNVEESFDKILCETQRDFPPSKVCTYHKYCQSPHCSLAVAKTICGHLFKSLKDVYHLTLTENHIPKAAHPGQKFLLAPIAKEPVKLKGSSNEKPLVAPKIASSAKISDTEPNVLGSGIQFAAWFNVGGVMPVHVAVQNTGSSYYTVVAPVGSVPHQQIPGQPLFYALPPTTDNASSMFYAPVVQILNCAPASTVAGQNPYPLDMSSLASVEPIAPRTKSFCSILMEQKRRKAYQSQKLEGSPKQGNI